MGSAADGGEGVVGLGKPASRPWRADAYSLSASPAGGSVPPAAVCGVGATLFAVEDGIYRKAAMALAVVAMAPTAVQKITLFQKGCLSGDSAPASD